jgi:hypothetical protein
MGDSGLRLWGIANEAEVDSLRTLASVCSISTIDNILHIDLDPSCLALEAILLGDTGNLQLPSEEVAEETPQ